MGWKSLKTAVLDSQLSPGLRYSSLLHAVTRYCFLTGASFFSVCEELGELHGFRYGRENTEATLVASLRTLESARAGFLGRLRAFAERRRSEKQRGCRQPRRVALRKLYSPLELGRPGRYSLAVRLDQRSVTE